MSRPKIVSMCFVPSGQDGVAGRVVVVRDDGAVFWSYPDRGDWTPRRPVPGTEAAEEAETKEAERGQSTRKPWESDPEGWR